eukprot:scaffold92676_cov35-Prasinocladus_malaysianus.AAC.1
MFEPRYYDAILGFILKKRTRIWQQKASRGPAGGAGGLRTSSRTPRVLGRGRTPRKAPGRADGLNRGVLAATGRARCHFLRAPVFDPESAAIFRHWESTRSVEHQAGARHGRSRQSLHAYGTLCTVLESIYPAFPRPNYTTSTNTDTVSVPCLAGDWVFFEYGYASRAPRTRSLVKFEYSYEDVRVQMQNLRLRLHFGARPSEVPEFSLAYIGSLTHISRICYYVAVTFLRAQATSSPDDSLSSKIPDIMSPRYLWHKLAAATGVLLAFGRFPATGKRDFSFHVKSAAASHDTTDKYEYECECSQACRELPRFRRDDRLGVKSGERRGSTND